MDNVRKQIVEYVKGQIGVDLEKYRTDFTKRWERKNEIIVEWREMPRTDWQKVERLIDSRQKLRAENVGVWGKMITCR